MAIVDVERAAITGIYPLGFKNHSLAANALDPSDRDGPSNAGSIKIGTWPVFGMYQPDEIKSFRSKQGRDYIVTANEGDARAWDGKLLATCLSCL